MFRATSVRLANYIFIALPTFLLLFFAAFNLTSPDFISPHHISFYFTSLLISCYLSSFQLTSLQGVLREVFGLVLALHGSTGEIEQELETPDQRSIEKGEGRDWKFLVIDVALHLQNSLLLGTSEGDVVQWCRSELYGHHSRWQVNMVLHSCSSK